MKRFTLMTLVSLMLMAFAATAMAAEPVNCSSAKLNSWDFLVDYSGSMAMKHKLIGENKLKVARKLLSQINERIPELGYQGSIHTFAPTTTVLRQQTYDRGVFEKAIPKIKETYDVFNRLTRMGDGINHWSREVYKDQPTPTAVIIMSDGGTAGTNRGSDVIEAAQAAMADNPGLIFHIISFADSHEGQATLDGIANLRPGQTVMVRAEDLLDNPANLDRFVQEVFCGAGKVVLRSVQFALNSSKINRDSSSVLDELGNLLKGRGSNITIAGHTCSLGSAKYNQRLSERRAAAVKSYLTKLGIPASTMKTRGYGESKPKFDNSTDEGRRMNRRAEIDFQ